MSLNEATFDSRRMFKSCAYTMSHFQSQIASGGIVKSEIDGYHLTDKYQHPVTNASNVLTIRP